MWKVQLPDGSRSRRRGASRRASGARRPATSDPHLSRFLLPYIYIYNIYIYIYVYIYIYISIIIIFLLSPPWINKRPPPLFCVFLQTTFFTIHLLSKRPEIYKIMAKTLLIIFPPHGGTPLRE